MLFDQSKPTYTDLVKKMGKIQNPKFDVVDVTMLSDHQDLTRILNQYKSNRSPFTTILIKHPK